MLRRPFLDNPMSRLATWSARFAWFALAVAALSVVILRAGVLEVGPSLATFAAALIFAGLAVLLAFAAFVVIWREGLAGLGRALTGLALGLALLAYPAYLGARAFKLPAINDIATDTAHPPAFDVLARLRPRDRIAYPGAKAAALQHAAYPDIAPLQEDASAAVAYRIALAVVTKRKWLVVDARAPAPRRDGIIEAVARTTIMGFRDDVVIRVRAVEGGARIDARSASRYGTHDLGANAARLRALLNDIDEAVNAAPPDQRTEPEKKPPPKPPDRRQPAKR
jgi:uncharacterized protein (DUF1499 family)